MKAEAKLSAEEELATLGERVAIGKGGIIYRAGERAAAVYEIIDGIVKTYDALPGRGACITAFLYPGDVFGLAAEGRYLHSAAAVLPVRLRSIKLARLKPVLHRAPEIDLLLLCKLSHELREAERHEVLLARKDAVGRLAMFFAMLRRMARRHNGSPDWLALPMRRNDIADYLAITREALSRAAKKLVKAGVVAYPDLRHVHIADPAALEAMAGGNDHVGPAHAVLGDA